MRRLPVWAAGLGLVLALGLQAPRTCYAVDATVGFRVGDPYTGPELRFTTEPNMVLIPRTRVYYVQDSDYDLYRLGNNYYFYYDGAWYRARNYAGPYTFIGYRSVPRPIASVAPQYRRGWTVVRTEKYGTYKNGRWYPKKVKVKTTTTY